MPGTNCAKAIQLWMEKNEMADPEQAEVVKLLCLSPPIEKMDNALNSLANCKRLSLSTNCIDKMIPLQALTNLEILSLGRNNIKKIAGLEDMGQLKQLWLSYNLISSLDGLGGCSKLTTLFISNNKIGKWDELLKLGSNPELASILLKENPIYDDLTEKERRHKVVEQLPKIGNIDGKMATGDDDDDEEDA